MLKTGLTKTNFYFVSSLDIQTAPHPISPADMKTAINMLYEAILPHLVAQDSDIEIKEAR